MIFVTEIIHFCGNPLSIFPKGEMKKAPSPVGEGREGGISQSNKCIKTIFKSVTKIVKKNNDADSKDLWG